MDLTVKQDLGRRLVLALGVSGLAIALIAPAASAATPKTKVASQTNADVQTSEYAHTGDISKTGQFVVFVTAQNGIDRGDNNNWDDVFRRNMKAGSTKIVSVSSSEKLGDGSSWDPVVSEDGKVVAFTSNAGNLLDGKVTSNDQVYVRNVASGKTSLVSKGGSGAANGDSEDAHLSSGGRYIVFHSVATNLTKRNTGGLEQIYLRDRSKGKTFLISRNKKGKAGNGDSFDAQVSQGGRFVVYTSSASNLVGTFNKGKDQIYKFDRVTGKTSLISKNNKGKAGNFHSADAEIAAKAAVIVYESDASNLIGNDTNDTDDVFMRKNGRTSRVSKNHRGKQLNGSDGAEDPDISNSGRWLTFMSDATNATKAPHNGAYDHAYLRDLKTGKLTLVSRNGTKIGNDSANDVQISDDGRFVSFGSDATNLIPGGDANADEEDVLRRGPYH
jgi:hypothetical protein